MKTILSTFTMTAAVSFSILAGQVRADDKGEVIQAVILEEDSAQERINLSGKLRMLSQRIPAAACHLAENVEPEATKKLLTAATAEFEKILNGLEFGDADLNIKFPEDRRKTLVKLQELRAAWEPFKAAAVGVAAGDNVEENLQVILGQNMSVLDSAKLLVSELVSQYSNPAEMVQADALLIDIAGRQRMLTQKMSKESCMLASHHETPETADQLQGTMQMFEVSLQALRHGMPDAGIRKPPTSGIAAGLEEVFKNWSGVKPTLETLLAGAEIGVDVESGKFHALNTTMAKMNEVVGMYAKVSKNEL